MKAPASKAAKTGKPTTKGAAARTSSATPKPGSSAKAPVKAAAKAVKPAAKVVPKPAAKTVAKPAAKAPVSKGAARPAAKAAPKASVKTAAKPAVKSAVKSAAKTAAKPVAKPPVKAPAKQAARPLAKAPAKAAAKAPAKAAAKPVAKAPAKTPVKTPAKTPSAKAAPAKAAPVKAAPAQPPVSSAVKASPAPADKVHAAPKPAAVIEPTPRPLGKRAAKKVMMEQMTQAEVVPTHAPDAAKATFSPTIARVMTPPVPSSIQKDPKRANNWKTLPVEQLTDQDIQAMPESEYMGEVQLAFFRRKLQQLKADMLANAGQTTEHLREDTVVVPDPADRATIEEEHALELRTRDRERKLLKKIEQAIARIDAGDYGYCEETGEPIGVARLMARPTASLSLEAQQRRELKQKMFGD